MKKLFISLFTAASALSLVACGSAPQPMIGPMTPAMSQLPRAPFNAQRLRRPAPQRMFAQRVAPQNTVQDPMLLEAFGEADKNQDGLFTLTEINACSSALNVTEEHQKQGIFVLPNNFTEADIARVDMNQDGQLTLRELSQLMIRPDSMWLHGFKNCK